MKRSIQDIPKRGRPKTTGRGTGILVRLHDAGLVGVDGWIERQSDSPSRPEAIRRLVEIGLSIPSKPKRATDKARKAASLAAEKHAMDHMDKALKGETASVKAFRKKQLTSMPAGLKRR